jgi:hypothetical protein
VKIGGKGMIRRKFSAGTNGLLEFRL